ncbi:hypothetical protein GCK72_006854 [Caenorhabditis remanei]|uniref:BTB domain-containing protein n=1 Tax=Caenorhabditis remanei TaxID=31234 RepID=A0A6A5HJN5_CAERE|nr:hypothetical protein GCK72_006854 [Caenorhabditis remanei]KAF1766896.1 hypothetical protein GCK72_006854 [Caenorhabditis remanei]
MTKRNNKRPPPPKRQRIEAENNQNAENNTNDQHPLTLQKMYDTCQEVLEKQKNLEKIHENMLKEVLEKQKVFVDKLCSVENELQLIRDDLKPRIVKAAVPVKRDDEDETDSESDNESDTMPTTGKNFVLKHVFKNVSNMKEDEHRLSEAEEYYGVKWRMGVRRTKEHLEFYLHCPKLIDTANWTIEIQQKGVFISNRVENTVKKGKQIFNNKSPAWGWPGFIAWDVLEKNLLVDDQLTAEMHVKIKKTTGIYKDHLRSFDKTMEEFSDVVLVVNEEKFYVSKLYLAAHSPYFKVLFLGNFNDSKKSEIKLNGIDADDFQNYLELLYGEHPIDEFTVEGMLMVADMYDTPMVIRKCEQFLLKESKKKLKKKLELSTRYNLEALKKKCLAEIKSIGDLQAVLPGNVQDLDKSIMGELLEKSISLHN